MRELATFLAGHVLALALFVWIGGATRAEAMGAASGAQTQPATLAAAYELTGRAEESYVAYAVVHPAAMIGKIVLAQIMALSG